MHFPLTQLLEYLGKSPVQHSFQPWHQKKLELALIDATCNGYWEGMLLLIKAGACNFVECIEASYRSNHICAFLRLCQAAKENDEQTIRILIQSNEEDFLNNSCSEKLMVLHLLLVPLLQNGKLNFSIPIRIDLDAGHKSLAGYMLQHSSKHPRTGTV